MRIINPTILCLLLCVINPVSAQDMSEWSDKTICRLAQAQKENLIFIEEAKLRSLPCVEMSVEKLSTTQVKKLQYDLAVMGFDVGSFDGKLSEKITSALTFKSLPFCISRLSTPRILNVILNITIIAMLVSKKSNILCICFP